MSLATMILADLAQVMPQYIATGLASSLCTIQSPPGTVDPSGQQDLDPADYMDVSGLINIPCQIAPDIIDRPTNSDEEKYPSYTIEQNYFHVLLIGYYPAIIQNMQAVIDGIVYDILTAEPDSQKIMTRMAVRRYSL